MTYTDDIARETACATLGGLVSWQPVEHVSGRRGRRYIFQSTRPLRVGVKAPSFEVRVLLAG